jgi:hypothetical protein
MRILGQFERYQRYKAICLLLGQDVMTFRAWRQETERIFDGWEGWILE